jgi:HEAT repeat protein
MDHRFPRLVSAVLLLALAGAPAAADTADEQTLEAAGVGTDGPALLAFLRKRTLTPRDRDELERLVRQLGDPSYKARQKATAALVARGSLAAAALEKAARDSDPEVARRAEEALRRIGQQDRGPAVTLAAVRVLAARKPPAAAETLLAFLPFAENSAVADEVVDSLGGLAARGGKPEPVLVAALKDAAPVKRAAAAEALCRAGLLPRVPAVRKLLTDADGAVRLRAALALAAAGEKKAVSVLIDLLAELPPDQAYAAQDFLYRLAEDDSPAVPLGRDGEGRRKCRDAWKEWYRRHGARADLARLGAAPRLRGYTMLVLLDAGKVLERDASGKQLWEIDGLEFPLDVQRLPGGRLLVAEHNANRVTERDRKGRVLWQKRIAQPIMAQRLPGGHTFIATRNDLVEVDRAGKELFRYTPPGGELLMRAAKLPGGELVYVSQDQFGATRCVRLDAGKRQLASFAVHVGTYGGRIDVLPRRHLLIPEMAYNRVTEYDASGTPVRRVRVQQPVAVVQLPGGNLLVTMYNGNRALELDKDGDIVAEFRADTRVNRAWRR